MMESSESDFISLVASGAGLTTTLRLSSQPDWKRIYQLAEEHTVLGILADAISGNSQKGDDCLGVVKEQLFDDALEIVRRNKHVNEVLARLVAYLENNGIKTILQKGQGLAQLYPNPMMRMSGDIDLLIRESDFERARVLLKQKAVETDVTRCFRDRHATYDIDGVEVELHASEFDSMHDGTYERYGALLNEMWERDERRTYQCEGQTVYLAPATFDVFYTFLHMIKHYYLNGVGMRQLLDFSLALHKLKADREQLNRWAESFSLKKEWDAFCNVWNDKQLLNVILRQGNMGRSSKHRFSKWYVIRLLQLIPENYRISLRYLPFSKRKFMESLVWENVKSLRYFWIHRIKT